mgnify:CR=1 FL=1
MKGTRHEKIKKANNWLIKKLESPAGKAGKLIPQLVTAAEFLMRKLIFR